MAPIRSALLAVLLLLFSFIIASPLPDGAPVLNDQAISQGGGMKNGNDSRLQTGNVGLIKTANVYPEPGTHVSVLLGRSLMPLRRPLQVSSKPPLAVR